MTASSPAPVAENNAAGYQPATRLPVMLLGGVGGMRSQGGSDGASQIASCVAAHRTARIVGGVTLYDLTQPSS
jgi:hypothetical protein